MKSDTLSFDDALAQLLAAARAPQEHESLPLDEALGRALAAPLVSGLAVPPLDNSGMDGYALRLAEAGDSLPVSQRIAAGQVGAPLAPGTAARIFTGAPVPEGADTVVMQEDCEVTAGPMGERVRVTHPPRLGANIRRAGEDIRPDQTVIEPGALLTPAHLGVAASIGATRLTVARRLRVATFFTGDELVMPGQPLPPGRIYNSNRAALLGLLQHPAVERIDLGQVPDTLEATVDTLQVAARRADVVITTGGASVGEEDHIRAAVTALGEVALWQVAMKPGKPLLYGRVGEADFIGLPGNPVSAMVVFELFARPFLRARMGAPASSPTRFTVPAGFDWSKPGKRREFLRARIEDGRAVLFPSQSSGVLSAMAWAQGLVDLPADTAVTAGETVQFLPLTRGLA